MLRIGRSLLFASILLLLTTSLLWAAAEEPYQEIDVRLPAGSSLQQLLQIHPDLEVMNLGDGDVRLLSRPSLTEKIEQQGWSVEIVHPDLESFYVQRNPPVLDYGVWHTYQETIDELNLLHSQYPNLTTAPFSIGTTGEGRQIWAIKVSDNPNADEDEPEVLYDGVHHAREIMTVEMCLYFPRYLCENYGTDPLATFLVDNREIWFVPIFNVDGFVYNELTNPNGGGMWRKNRRNNGGGCYGVDVNRNYPYEWGYGGGSGYPCDETYWGPSAASEPENQAMINLMNDRHFVVQDSWHSVAGLILFSWGYTLQHTPDDALLRAVGQERSRDNGYVVGQPPEVLYSVNGGMNDYAYGAHHIFSYTTEFGGSGFWPNQSEREGLLAENLHSILYLTQVAGPSIGVQSLVVSGGNGKIEPGETVDMVATIVNDGIFSDLTNLSIQLRCDDPYITLIDATNPLGTLGAGETVTNAIDPFQVHAETICPQGRMVTFTVVANADGGVRIEVPFEFEIGSLPVIVSNDFETTGGAWQQDVTHTATTGAWVRVDPVQTPHQPGDDTTPAPGVNAWITAQNPTGDDGTDDVDSGISASRSPDFNLAGHGRVRLSLNYFMGQRDNGDDPNGDFFRIDVSPDAGATWVNLLQLGDVAMLPEWRNLRVDLNDFIPMTSQVCGCVPRPPTPFPRTTSWRRGSTIS
ncbi:MAG: M14 family metallopeptidase [Candidatus Eisenbacteria bacterium]|nr:M14 family metallopeptidase [Candidatus Eisenbacteria bacterium]